MFCEDFRTTVEDMITEGISERLQTDLTDDLHTEYVQQASFAQEKCRLFHGRQQFLDVIKNKIRRNKYVLHRGVSLLLVMVLGRCGSRHKPKIPCSRSPNVMSSGS